jgi:chromosome segregation ATPase
MGCGSALGDLFYLADALAYRTYDFHRPPDRWRNEGEVSESLRARLYRMHGEGLISEEVFNALQVLADRGQLRPADLAVHLARARRGGSEGGDAAIGNALRGIRSRHAKLVQARVGSEKVLADLEARLSELDERIAAKEQTARQSVIKDEETARQRLTEKAELASNRERLAAQAQALRADLARLDELNLQLETKSAELEAVQARSVAAQSFLTIELE